MTNTCFRSMYFSLPAHNHVPPKLCVLPLTFVCSLLTFTCCALTFACSGHFYGVPLIYECLPHFCVLPSLLRVALHFFVLPSSFTFTCCPSLLRAAPHILVFPSFFLLPITFACSFTVPQTARTTCRRLVDCKYCRCLQPTRGRHLGVGR